LLADQREDLADVGVRVASSIVRLAGALDETVVFSEPPQTVTYEPPSRIFSEPHDRACLHGVQSGYDRLLAEKKLSRLAKATIVGWRTAMDEDGRLFVAGEADGTLTSEDFRKRFHAGYEGFVFSPHQENVIYAASPSIPIEYPGITLFIPFVEQGNYGSFLIRGLPALLFANASRIRFDRIVVPERTTWVADALRLTGMGDIPAYSVRDVCGDRFEELLIATVSESEGLLDRKTMDRVGEFARGALSSYAPGQRLYVSRRLSNLYRPDYRVLDNVADVEALAVASGFTIVHPETLSLDAQIRAFEAAEFILGPSGSGMLSAMFARPGTKVLDMESFHSTVRQHAKLYSSSRMHYGFLFGEILEPNRPPASSRWSVGLPDLSDALAAWT
jgi:hypothetical protein